MRTTILVVEDDRSLAGTIELALVAFDGCETVTVNDGQRAIQHLSGASAPALVITDLDLPRVDGYQLIQWMRNTPHLLPVPVLAMSARNDAEGALAAGANRFILKPFKLAAFRERVQELLNE
ncbi:MAG: response regulator [Acidobacteria bacterium]|nr:response regulator [Acidobacteriota bacterium]